MSDTRVGNIIPIFSTILYPDKFEVSNQQRNDLVNVAQNMKWQKQDDVDNVRSESLHVILVSLLRENFLFFFYMRNYNKSLAVSAIKCLLM